MTADTYSATLGVILMGTGNDNNTWGSNANSLVFQILEDAIANVLTSSVAGGTLDLSGSPPPAAASQVRYAALAFSGTLLSNQVVQVPNLTKWWMVRNDTAGAFTLKFKTPAGSASAAIPQNSGWQTVFCDGANNIVVSPYNFNQQQMPDGSVSAPAYSWASASTSGWYRQGANNFRFSVGGADAFWVTNSGPANGSGQALVAITGSGTSGHIPSFNSGLVVQDSGIVASTVALLTAQDQTLSGGANVTAYSLGSLSGGGTTRIDCGKSPLQYCTNAGNFTLQDPLLDGSCLILVTNNASAGTISFSGFSVGSNTGDALDTTNGHKFIISITRINSITTYFIKALQ